MKELGDYLKENRENQGVSIEEAAEDLKVAVAELENIELGNTRAFKDVYTLRELVTQYAKYLGLKPEKILDEFNDFLFEHTSKISLEDILEAKKKQEAKEETRKISSPYTKIPPAKRSWRPFLLICIILLLLIIIFLLLKVISSREPKITNELCPMERNVELL